MEQMKQAIPEMVSVESPVNQEKYFVVSEFSDDEPPPPPATITLAGNQSLKSPDGTNEKGHTGNGFCRITRKSGKIFVKQNGSWIKV